MNKENIKNQKQNQTLINIELSLTFSPFSSPAVDRMEEGVACLIFSLIWDFLIFLVVLNFCVFESFFPFFFSPCFLFSSIRPSRICVLSALSMMRSIDRSKINQSKKVAIPFCTEIKTRVLISILGKININFILGKITPIECICEVIEKEGVEGLNFIWKKKHRGEVLISVLYGKVSQSPGEMLQAFVCCACA